MQVIKNGYLLQQTKQNYMKLRQEYHALLAQRNALASYERIEQIAREELQLDAPREDQLQFIHDPAAKGAVRAGWGHFWDWLTPR
jgi:cell division protein FtsL